MSVAAALCMCFSEELLTMSASITARETSFGGRTRTQGTTEEMHHSEESVGQRSSWGLGREEVKKR